MPGNTSTAEAGRGNSSSAPAEETRREKQARRIRENQRRARQKRKDHIEELQNKLRQCQSQGVQASAEIQAAARKVLEENTKLRHLLSMLGVCDDVISEFLVTGELLSVQRRSRPGYLHRRPVPVGNSFQELERLMEPRRPMCFEPSEPFCTSSAPNPGYPRPTDGVVSTKNERSIVAANPSWAVNTPRDGPTGSVALQEPQYRTPQQTQYIMAPSSATSLSRSDAALALTGLAQVDAVPQSSATVSNRPLPTPPYTYSVQSFPGASGYSQHQASGQDLLLQGPAGAPSAASSSYLNAAQPPDDNGAMASDLMSGMTGVVPHTVCGQLGSITGCGGPVDNVHFASVMDRYT